MNQRELLSQTARRQDEQDQTTYSWLVHCTDIPGLDLGTKKDEGEADRAGEAPSSEGMAPEQRMSTGR
jgi:hypothetical protein